jgi:hypothetical protein
MSLLPLHVHQGLGLGTLVVGLVAGSVTDLAAMGGPPGGHTGRKICARRGLAGRRSIRAPLPPVAPFHRISGDIGHDPAAGRALLGGAESLIVLAVFNWGLALAGPQNAGMLMAQIGTAMYLAYAVGAPVSSALYAADDFAAIAVATILIPLVTLLLAAPLRAVAAAAHVRPSAELPKEPVGEIRN